MKLQLLIAPCFLFRNFVLQGTFSMRNMPLGVIYFCIFALSKFLWLDLKHQFQFNNVFWGYIIIKLIALYKHF